ncbi:phosphocholine cytidylyltransferase family protein [Brevibacillus humidisoli]|uniref:phosphocholine cytidylyltransferase family protein n=1 Tax=Brevibacillus humidisoli TaxID=2895522 RepID=UPI001E40657E|nr:phosphocholine cytidylyltransferase family protein [Brevibacillus humidisoli]UFJ42510.1 phosphocholine cytidylyltransferase family protein [Brevibacillus humidisoli]
MKAVLMAAGMGTRVSKEIKSIPKCTVRVGEKTLIEHTISQLRRKEVKEIAVVVGYQANRLCDLLKGEGLHIYHNPFFDMTNSIASLWFAREFLHGDDFLLLNADLYMEERVLDEILADEASPVLFSDGTRRKEADYKLSYRDGVLQKHGKELDGDEVTGEYLGIAKICRPFLPLFKERMEQLINRQQHHLWWENVLYSFIGERDVYVEEIPPGLFWAEVDTLRDYERILEYANKLAKV